MPYPKQTLDPEILCWCEENNFILNPNLRVGENIEELILVALASEDGKYQDRIVYLPLP